MKEDYGARPASRWNAVRIGKRIYFENTEGGVPIETEYVINEAGEFVVDTSIFEVGAPALGEGEGEIPSEPRPVENPEVMPEPGLGEVIPEEASGGGGGLAGGMGGVPGGGGGWNLLR